MAMTLVQWEARLEILQKAATSGILQTRHGDTQLTYQSMEDLMRAIAYAESQINRLNGTARKPRYVQQDSKDL